MNTPNPTVTELQQAYLTYLDRYEAGTVISFREDPDTYEEYSARHIAYMEDLTAGKTRAQRAREDFLQSLTPTLSPAAARKCPPMPSFDYRLAEADLTLWMNEPIPGEFSVYIEQIRQERARQGQDCWIGAEHPRYSWVFSRLVAVSRPQFVLEIGVQSGGSAYGLTRNLAPEALFVGIDNEDSGAARGASAAFQRLFYREQNHFLIDTAAAALPTLDHSWDLVHFDHYKDRYLPDLDLLLRLGQAHAATIFLFHDTESYAKDLRGAIEARFDVHLPISVNEGALVCQGFHA